MDEASDWTKEEGATAWQNLRKLLSDIMIRRTQADVLSTFLPPRTDAVIFCGFTASQQSEYAEVVFNIKR